MKNPWMPMYWADYLADTSNLTHLENSVYILLIAHYWCNGGLPNDDRQLARIAKVDYRKWKKIRPAVVAKFAPAWVHKRIDFELANALKLRERKREKDRRWADKRRTQHGRAVGDNYSHNYKESKSQNGKLAGTGSAGYVASPQSEEFKKWKAWAFEKQTALWRELQQREIEGRPFNFETQWPPN